jgi:hypothetical protein
MGRTREEIDKEYAELCTKYGHLCQQILSIKSQKEELQEAHDKNIEQCEESEKSLEVELVAIEMAWKQLKEDIKALE